MVPSKQKKIHIPNTKYNLGMQFFGTSTTGNMTTCLHSWKWEHDNVSVGNMHSKDYLERNEEFRSLVHIRLQEKKWLKIEWGEGLQMNLKFLKVDRSEWLYLEVVVWEVVQKIPFLLHIKHCWKFYFEGPKFLEQAESAIVVQKKTVCNLPVRSLLGPTLYRVWYNIEAQTNLKCLNLKKNFLSLCCYNRIHSRAEFLCM